MSTVRYPHIKIGSDGVATISGTTTNVVEIVQDGMTRILYDHQLHPPAEVIRHACRKDAMHRNLTPERLIHSLVDDATCLSDWWQGAISASSRLSHEVLA